MKKGNLMSIVAVTAIFLSLCSCGHDRFEIIDLHEYQVHDTSSATGSSFKVLYEFDSDINNSQILNAVHSLEMGDIMEDDALPTKATSSNVVGIACGLLSSSSGILIHQIVGTYTSIDVNGRPVTVSGKIFYPKGQRIKNMIVVSHYTIGSNMESPSESFSFEGIFAAKGYLVVVADYLGYGVTSDAIHPYLQAETCASNVLDMAIAAKPFLDSRGIKPESEKIILVGYSQGGATTLHAQRMLEQDDRYMGKFTILKNYAGAGPYNIARTYDYVVNRDRTGIPCAVPMIIQGMNQGMSHPIDMSFFFKEPLLSNYKEWINSKKYTVNQISTLMGTNRVSNILTEEARDKNNDETARFYKELIHNSIPISYIPQAQLYMFHSEDDQTVPFVNSQLMQRQFREFAEGVVEYDFGHYGNHQTGAIIFMMNVYADLR